jgi:hypothetical protein
MECLLSPRSPLSLQAEIDPVFYFGIQRRQLLTRFSGGQFFFAASADWSARGFALKPPIASRLWPI